MLDGQCGLVEAGVLSQGLFNAGAGSTHQHQILDVGHDLGGQRLIGDVLIVAARNEDDLLVKAAQARNGAGGAGADGIVVVEHAVQRAHRLNAVLHAQFRKMYGIVEGVSDRPYVSNSFHCHVTEDITPIEKQDCEGRFWELCNGGKIQYVRYPIGYNVEAIRSLVRRAMDLGYYEGVNLSLAYCDDCGHEELEMDVCPVCGSKNLTKIDRMNGYLSYSRVHGDTRLNAAKMAEIAERKSM